MLGRHAFTCGIKHESEMFALEAKAEVTIIGSSLAAFAWRHGIEHVLRLSLRGLCDDG